MWQEESRQNSTVSRHGAGSDFRDQRAVPQIKAHWVGTATSSEVGPALQHKGLEVRKPKTPLSTLQLCASVSLLKGGHSSPPRGIAVSTGRPIGTGRDCRARAKKSL